MYRLLCKKKRKNKIIIGFKTVFSNDAVVAAGRNLPWFIPILIALASVVLALIPSFVTGIRSDMGYSSLGANSYGYENGLVAFGDFLESEKNTLSMKIENNELKVTGWNEALDHRNAGSQWFSYPITEPLPQPETSSSSAEASTSTEVPVVVTPTVTNGFEVFYYEENENIKFEDFRTRILQNLNPYTIQERFDNPDRTYGTTYRTNLLLLAKDRFYFAKFQRTVNGTGSHFYGKFDHPSMQGMNLLDLYKVSVDATPGSLQRTNEIRNNWKDFFRNSYESTKSTSVWSMTGVMFGVDIGVILLFGLVLFIMTRGKNNPFRTIKWYETMMMAGWASFSPAVIAIPIGFLLSQFSAFIFIFLYGLRVMWMSMRALRPYEVAK